MTTAHLLVPGGVGFQRQLARQCASESRAALKKRLEEVAGTTRWEHEGGVRRRIYASPEDYTEHQKLKLEIMSHNRKMFRKLDILEYRLRFWRRFRHLHRFVAKDAQILCLGARQGTEVEVLRELGFANAWGVDLNPGKDNPLVRQGNFMALDVPDASLDVVYSNCVDHASDLEGFVSEQARVLKPTGVTILDVTSQPEAGPYEVLDWSRAEEALIAGLRHFRDVVMLRREKNWMWTMLRCPVRASAPDART